MKDGTENSTMYAIPTNSLHILKNHSETSILLI
jgi:hypothetical protein